MSAPSPSVAIDVDEADFQTLVLERSFQVPVVVDFWASWCGPCRTLTPILERLAMGAEGGWILAKVDVDANQNLSSALGIQGIPSVRAFKDGRQVAEFTGALPEDHVRTWLRQLGPTKGDLSLARGREAEKIGDLAGAVENYRATLAEEPGSEEARRSLARVELQQRVAASSGTEDPTVLADVDVAGGRPEAAFTRLIEAIGSAAGDERERLRLHLLELIATLEPSDPRVAEARKRLGRVLY
ncbi:MAG TPA: tetratricopeptide repeat protein [Actinomycetota bacterium]|nr:tetratricopeptide repeat protein [Actinomycetota bacterium]